jgi:hypothetical protein
MPPPKSRLAPLAGCAAFLFVIALLPVGFYLLLINLDHQDTFHNTTSVADVDGDGDLDVILHNVRNESEFTAFSGLTLWLNQGDGHFTAQKLDTGTGWASAAGDLDQDGDEDLLIFDGVYLRLLFNQGGLQQGQIGEFKYTTLVLAPTRQGQYGSIALGDLNQDGLLDGVIVGCCGRLFTLDPEDNTPNDSWVWINGWNSAGWLARRVSYLSALDGLAVRAAELGDLDGDGDPDLVAAVIAPSQSLNQDPADRVLLNDGTGNFSDSGQRLGSTDSTSLALGDLDGDRDLDAMIGSAGGVALWINQGGAQAGSPGTFVMAGGELPASQTQAIFLSDLDDDGDLDALVAGAKEATLWWNDGQAAFSQSGRRFRYNNRHGLAVADFNGDGRPDIFAAEYDTHFRVWLNQGDGTFR